jgi:hypothetical protein
MNDRKNLVLAAIVALVAIIGLVMGYMAHYSSLTAKRNELSALESKIKANKKIVATGQQAAARMAGYEGRALPPNVERSQSMYQRWLLELVGKHGFKESNVTAAASRGSKNSVYHRFVFNIDGKANLVQVTRLLYDFYAVDHLHRVSVIRLKPLESTKDLDIDLKVEVLSMPGAPAKLELAGKPSTRLPHGDVEAYVKSIAARNFFGPPHLPPTLTDNAKREYYIGSNVTFYLRGDDPEKTPISYILEKSIAGAKLDPQTGSFSWTPNEKGKYEVTVRATDGGIPAKSVAKTIQFAVVDPPPPTPPREAGPPPPRFDKAKFTFLTGVLNVDGEGEAWLLVRTTGELLKLRLGESFDVDTLKGKITQIGRQDIQIETSDGKHLLVTIGESLRDGIAVTAAEEPTSPTAATGSDELE